MLQVFLVQTLQKRVLNDEEDCKVICLDNMNDYYDVKFKEYRLQELLKFENFIFKKGTLADRSLVKKFFLKVQARSCCKFAYSIWCAL